MDRASRARHALQSALAAVIPPVFAFGVESVLLAPVSRRWLVFTAAALASSWLGGFEAGIVATVLSAVLAWWFLVPPERLFAANDPTYYVAVAFFIAIGVAVSSVHGRLSFAQRETRIARLNAERAASMLERTARQLQSLGRSWKTPRISSASRMRASGPYTSTHTDAIWSTSQATCRSRVRRSPNSIRREAHDFSVVNVMLRTAVEQGEWEGETMMVNWRTGAAIPVWAKVFVIKDRDTGNPLGVATITRDISEFKRTRDELERAARQLQIFAALVENSSDFIGIADENRHPIYVNPGGRHLVDYPGDLRPSVRKSRNSIRLRRTTSSST